MKVSKFPIVVIIALIIISCNKPRVTNKSLSNGIDSMSYSLGLDMGLKLRANLPNVDEELYIQGMMNGIDSTGLKIEVKDINEVINGYMEKRREEKVKIAQEERMQKAEKEFGHIRKEGLKYLEENKNNPDVITTESGLQYIILKAGTGENAKGNSRVSVHFRGMTPSGEVFDSSDEKGDPRQVVLNRVMKGWTEGITLMNTGAKYKFFIPQELAYGINPPQNGSGPIKPMMPVVFEIELIEIHK